MTITKLHKILTAQIQDGHGECDVYIDRDTLGGDQSDVLCPVGTTETYWVKETPSKSRLALIIDGAPQPTRK